MKRIKCLFMVALALGFLMCFGQDAMAQTKMTQKVKPKASFKAKPAQATLQGKITTQTNGKKASELTAEQKAKKNLANRPASKVAVAPTKVVPLKERKISEAKKNEARAKLKAKRTKRNFDFSNSKGKFKKKN